VKVRAAVLDEMGRPGPYAETKPLVSTELELQDPGPGELLVRVHAAGLCHSDLSVVEGTRPRVMPMALGHEAAGEVVAVGRASDSSRDGPGDRDDQAGFAEPAVATPDFRPGDHVVLAFVPACGNCRFCLAGRPALCLPGAEANGAGTLLGGDIRLSDMSGNPVHHHLGVSAFSDYVVVSRRSAVKVPNDLPHEVAALFGCAVLTGAGAVLNTGADALPAGSIAVFGLGGVGLAGLLAAASTRPDRLIAIDPVPAKRHLALELGATAALDPADPDCVRMVRDAAGDGVDLALETAGSERVLADAFAATGRGGTTVTVGLPLPHSTLSIPALAITAEERTLKGSYLGSCVPSRDIPRFIDMYRDGRLPVDRLLSHRLRPDEINEGFDRLARGEAVRQVIHFD
jgi:alcohol dehydrogenase